MAARYAAKTAYRGDIATRYDADRKGEALWGEEQDFVRRWIERLPTGATVLDVPVGTGRFLPTLIERGCHVVGFDISADMIAEARRSGTAIEAGIRLEVGDAEQMALPNQSVDAVICWRFFHLIPSSVMHRVLHEFRRVSRGPVLVQVLQVQLPAANPWAALKNRLRPWYRRLRPMPVNQPWGHITSYPHPEQAIRAAFAATGWRVVEETRMTDSAGMPVKVYTLEP